MYAAPRLEQTLVPGGPWGALLLIRPPGRHAPHSHPQHLTLATSESLGSLCASALPAAVAANAILFIYREIDEFIYREGD